MLWFHSLLNSLVFNSMQISENPNQLMASASDCMWWDQPHLGSPLRQTLLDVPGCQCGRRPAWWTRCSGRRSRPTNTSLWKQWSQFKTHQEAPRHLQSHCLLPGFLYGSFLHFDFSTNGSRLSFLQKLLFNSSHALCLRVRKKLSPALRRTDNVLLVTACTGFGQTGDGGCVTKQHGPGTNLNRGQKKRIFFFFFTILRRKTWQKYKKKSSRTSSSGVMSHRQIWPSWQPVMMVLKSSITSRLLMQCVGAVRPHSTMGRTRLFPDMMPTRLKHTTQGAVLTWTPDTSTSGCRGSSTLCLVNQVEKITLDE